MKEYEIETSFCRLASLLESLFIWKRLGHGQGYIMWLADWNLGE